MMRADARHSAGSNPSRAGGDLEFDFAALLQVVRLCEEVDRAWQAALRRDWLQPLMLVYEELIEDHATMIRTSLEFLGPSHAALKIASAIGLEADPIAREWERRFRARAEELRSAAGQRVAPS